MSKWYRLWPLSLQIRVTWGEWPLKGHCPVRWLPFLWIQHITRCLWLITNRASNKLLPQLNLEQNIASPRSVTFIQEHTVLIQICGLQLIFREVNVNSFLFFIKRCWIVVWMWSGVRQAAHSLFKALKTLVQIKGNIHGVAFVWTKKKGLVNITSQRRIGKLVSLITAHYKVYRITSLNHLPTPL